MKEKKAITVHSVLDVISKRWSPRAFDPAKLIKKSDLMSILEAGRWAPSANNAQPWRCLVGLNFDESHGKILAALSTSNAVWAGKAPVLICLLSYPFWKGAKERNDWAEQDVGIFLGNLLLQATGLGIHSHPMAGFSRQKIVEAFKLSEELKPMTCIAFGYYGNPEELPEEKKEWEKAERQRMNMNDLIINGF